jgi:Fic family protein
MKKFKSGNFQSQGSFQSFIPNPINRKWSIDNMELIELLSKADRQLGRLDMYSEYIPDIDLFISMHKIKEATKSSRIEGTKTNIEDALLNKEDISEEKRDDWEEVQNYIEAMNGAVDELKGIPFSSRLIKSAHKTLLQGVRGKHKLPGEFRTSQNWIGGASINDATFIPPPSAQVNELMNDLEKFVHSEEIKMPHLLKIAIMHYQFETIHPFLDGNGRVGRLLITLYLVEKELLKMPILYLSDFFEKNRRLYYDNLTDVRVKNDIEKWCKFFLVGVIETAKSSILTLDKILKLKGEVDIKLNSLGQRSSDGALVLKELFKNPIIYPVRIKSIINKSAPTVYKLIKDLENLEILEEFTENKRNRVYVFREYFDVFS